MISSSKRCWKSFTPLGKFFFSTRFSSMQKIIVLYGPPGIGKGVFSRFLSQDFGYIKVSIGEELRKVLNNKTNYRLNSAALSTLHECMNAGKPVPDNIIMEVVYQKIIAPEAMRGVILDGFPRTINQLEMFQKVFPIRLVVNIIGSYDYIMASLLGRRTCIDCGMTYSAFSYYKDGHELDVQMPKKEGICDKCEGNIITRDDDKEDVVIARLNDYEKKTAPLLKKFEENGKLSCFEPKRGEKDYPQLQQLIISKVGFPYYYYQNQFKNYNTRIYYS